MIWRKQIAGFIVLTLTLVNGFSTVAAAAAQPPALEAPSKLSLLRLKMTGEEYVAIVNNGEADISDLSTYALRAFNNVNSSLSTATASSQSLPNLRLNKGESLLLSSLIRPTCGASLAGKLNISLVDGGGTLQIVTVPEAGSVAPMVVIDAVNWSSTTSGDIKAVPSNTKQPLASYYRYLTPTGTAAWQLAEQDTADQCTLKVSAADAAGQLPVSTDSEDNTVIIKTPVTENVAPVIESEPATLPPFLTEIMPNPIGSGNDATDEFIEIYNPNDTALDLGDYQLKSGLTSSYTYTFSDGTEIAALGYLTLYSTDSKLTLSNTIGQVRLISKSGLTLSTTDVYAAAKDGSAWSFVDGKWQWTTTPTPDKQNVLTVPMTAIKQPAVKNPPKLSTKKAAAKTAKSPKPAKVAKPKKPKAEKAAATSKFGAAPTAETVMSRPIQMRVVATVGAIALLYGAYEYRGSFANLYYKFRRKLGFGGPPGS